MKSIITLIIIVLSNYYLFAGAVASLIFKGRLKTTSKYIELKATRNNGDYSIQICDPKLYNEIIIIPTDGYKLNNNDYNPIISQFSTNENTDTLRIKSISNNSGSCQNGYGTFTYNINIFNYQSSSKDTIIQLPKCGKDIQISNKFIGNKDNKYYWAFDSAGYAGFAFDSILKIENPYSIIKDTTLYFIASNSYDWYATCRTYRKFIIKPAYQKVFSESICMVTNINNKNGVIWSNDKSFDVKSYKIYKQSKLSSNYDLIHEQSSNQLSQWIDTSSNPNTQIERYKLAIVDSCDYEVISSNHTTILLSSNLGINGTVNLSWNAYEGFNYSNFEIWRSTDGTNFNLLSSTANNTFSYIDNNPPTTCYYQIRISNPNGCTPDKRSYSHVNSNTVDKTGKSVASISTLTLPSIEKIIGYYDLLGRKVDSTTKNQLFIVLYESGRTEKLFITE